MTKMMLAATLHQILKLLLLLLLLPVEASNTIIDDIGATEKIVSLSVFCHPPDANLKLCQSPLAVQKCAALPVVAGFTFFSRLIRRH